ncbi:MAG: hypothetical protein KJ792_01685 [Actinobacteria bacterium]|nr:hypothetical protein [Actinomycetota bacterium]MCG2803645.1 hypothetical protein [Cellulomonas sp.]
MRRRPQIAALAAVVALLMTACSNPLPTAMPEAEAVAPPALSAVQSQAVVAAVGSVLSTSDKALDPAGLPARLTGPALAMRTAEYIRSTATGGAKPPTPLPANEATAVIPQTDVWPRTMLVITDQPDDLSARRVLVLQQAAPRDQYKLWGWARMFPGEFPTTAALTTGSAVLAADDPDLVVPPSAILSQYADVLANGAASASAAKYAGDTFRTAIEANRTQQQALAAEGGATFTETYTATDGPVVSLATQEGGALVVGQLSTTSTITAAQGGTLTNSDPFSAALAGAAPTTTLVRTYTDVLVFYVPPASAGGQVVALAAEQILTAAAVS